jgi:hypothetical protein
MKKGWKRVVLVCAWLCLPASGLLAQSVADDVQQLLMDVEKLSQLKKILQDMYNAYTIVKQGYEDIKNLSQGTFSLHKAFLDGLLAVSPAVANYGKVSDIINKEVLLIQEYQSASKYFNASGRFSVAELDYFANLYNNLIDGSSNNLNELTMVLTAGVLRMSDAERLSAIDRIDRSITTQLLSLQSFDNKTAIQDMQRMKDAQDVGTLKSLYGIGQ